MSGRTNLRFRSEGDLFVVSKSGDGKNLSLSINGGKFNRANAEACLLTPNDEGSSIYYAVSNCVVNGKQSPLGQVYFKIENDKTKMYFLYNVRASGDTLVKIR